MPLKKHARYLKCGKIISRAILILILFYEKKFGVEAAEILTAIEEGDVSNPLAIAYRLIIDNKRIEDDQQAVEEFK